ncbi:hypothetical protein EBZ38_17415, partial [bacterium]|nr:hypothetical protein [bacterium]NDD86041.1 hypothetical protein [bacterium]
MNRKVAIFNFDGSFNRFEDNRTIADAQNQNIDIARTQCTKTINDSGIDSTTQQNAALGIYPPERCEAIKSYIAACRNEYLRCKELILAATTNDEAAGAGEPHQHDDKFTLCRQASVTVKKQ